MCNFKQIMKLVLKITQVTRLKGATWVILRGIEILKMSDYTYNQNH